MSEFIQVLLFIFKTNHISYIFVVLVHSTSWFSKGKLISHVQNTLQLPRMLLLLLKLTLAFNLVPYNGRQTKKKTHTNLFQVYLLQISSEGSRHEEVDTAPSFGVDLMIKQIGSNLFAHIFFLYPMSSHRPFLSSSYKDSTPQMRVAQINIRKTLAGFCYLLQSIKAGHKSNVLFLLFSPSILFTHPLPPHLIPPVPISTCPPSQSTHEIYCTSPAQGTLNTARKREEKKKEKSVKLFLMMLKLLGYICNQSLA